MINLMIASDICSERSAYFNSYYISLRNWLRVP